MKTSLKTLSELIAQANDAFYAKNTGVDILMGLIDKALRQQGTAADAITLDCIALNKKIVFLLHDEKPSMVTVALGNKKGDIHSSSEYELGKLSVPQVLALMTTNFIA